MSRAKVWL